MSRREQRRKPSRTGCFQGSILGGTSTRTRWRCVSMHSSVAASVPPGTPLSRTWRGNSRCRCLLTTWGSRTRRHLSGQISSDVSGATTSPGVAGRSQLGLSRRTVQGWNSAPPPVCYLSLKCREFSRNACVSHRNFSGFSQPGRGETAGQRPMVTRIAQ